MIHFQYGFASWDDAVSAADGYDQINIIETVRQAAARVARGEAVYEIDGVNFDHIKYSWPLTASLMYAAANLAPRQRMMRVLDFGGALGTGFQQNRRFILRLALECDWRIVEQPAFVLIGQHEFTTPNLRFFPTIEAARWTGLILRCSGDASVTRRRHMIIWKRFVFQNRIISFLIALLLPATQKIFLRCSMCHHQFMKPSMQ